MADNVNHPSHYADHCSLECYKVMRLTYGPYHYFYYCLQNAFMKDYQRFNDVLIQTDLATSGLVEVNDADAVDVVEVKENEYGR